jgi:hypothetical protein
VDWLLGFLGGLIIALGAIGVLVAVMRRRPASAPPLLAATAVIGVLAVVVWLVLVLVD